MGAGSYVKMSAETDPKAALAAVVTELTESCYDWPDPAAKPGFVQVWDKPVADSAVEWMCNWTAQHPPEGVNPQDKWGPWMAFPLESGGWCFFGWVNE